MRRTLLFLFSFSLGAQAIASTVYKYDALLEEVKKGLPKIHGWCSEEKAKMIIDVILESKPKVCVEIGVFGGSSIFPIAKALKTVGEGKVWAIDPWKIEECLIGMENENSREWWSSFDLEEVYRSFISMLKSEKIDKYCNVLKMNSREALSQVPSQIDLLHIDGNHSEESCYFDISYYLPLVKEGGYIIFDDVLWTEGAKNHNTTKKAFKYALKDCVITKYTNDCNCALLKKISKE